MSVRLGGEEEGGGGFAVAALVVHAGAHAAVDAPKHFLGLVGQACEFLFVCALVQSMVAHQLDKLCSFGRRHLK
jgi:hypothetical protein